MCVGGGEGGYVQFWFILNVIPIVLFFCCFVCECMMCVLLLLFGFFCFLNIRCFALVTLKQYSYWDPFCHNKHTVSSLSERLSLHMLENNLFFNLLRFR